MSRILYRDSGCAGSGISHRKRAGTRGVPGRRRSLNRYGYRLAESCRGQEKEHREKVPHYMKILSGAGLTGQTGGPALDSPVQREVFYPSARE